tara:strand:- start:7541 stop:8383 length:843 start_codon:yes stop_codon:yes gene_type:complete
MMSTTEIKTPSIVNLAAYKFVDLAEAQLIELQQQLLAEAERLQIKGTILLGGEGINLIIAGERDDIDHFTTYMKNLKPFADITFKESLSEERPFRRMRVRLKQEIVTMRVPGVSPDDGGRHYLDAKQLKQWLDEGRDFTFLDTRNDYEVEIGTFDKAIDLDIEEFNEFPEKVKQLEADREKPMVMFCTGGIRCEKASVAAEQAGFKEVYQLHDGILKYFEECGGEHYRGDCFVFDRRAAITPELKETGITQCPRCDTFIQPEDQDHPKYVAWNRCQYCPS